MLDTQNCLQNHIKNAKTIKCLLQSAFYTGSTCKVLPFFMYGEVGAAGGAVPPPPPQFLPNFCKISLFCLKFWHFYAYSPHVPVSPRTFKFTSPSMFYNFWFKFYVAPTRLSTSYAYLTLKALRGGLFDLLMFFFYSPPKWVEIFQPNFSYS